MVWKTGKFGVHSGKTVRSRRSHPKRSEGLLIQTTVENACRKEDQDEGESITYSLGKQNRWLLPEIIKTTSFDLEEREFLGHGDEVVLVVTRNHVDEEPLCGRATSKSLFIYLKSTRSSQVKRFQLNNYETHSLIRSHG